MKQKSKGKRVLKIIVLSLCAVILIVAVWQIFEYHKLKSIMLPEGAVYQVHPNLPPIAADAIQTNRSHYLTRRDADALEQWGQRIEIPGLTQKEDASLATEALAYRQMDVQRPEQISPDDVRQELDFLGRYMKYSFALYSYRGGDDVFLPLLDEIEAEAKAASTNGFVQTNTYISILQEKILWAARDNHTYVGGQSHYDIFPERQFYSYTNECFAFDVGENSEFYLLENDSLTLQKINDTEPENYLKPSILKDGTIAYVPWLYTDSETEDFLDCTLSLLDSDGNTYIENIVLSKTEQYRLEDDTLYSLSENENYFYLKNSSLMSFPSTNKSILNQMVLEASSVNGEKPVIIDLRQHQGGYDLYAVFWLLNFLDVSKIQGLNIPIPVIAYDLETRTTQSLWKNKLASSVKNPGISNRYKDGGGFPLHLKNDTPIFVIIDRGCGSSGEWFTSYLSWLDNVVLVGENTKGLLIGGNQCTAFLPVSRCKVTFSTGINLISDMRDLEGEGLYPDLYVPPTEAVERVAAMIERYGI